MLFQDFKFKEVFNLTVIVAALGYFVDVYDLVVFLIVGIKSLKDLVPTIKENDELLISNFQYILNIQMIGMLIGGIFWGIIGDKQGRLSVLFGSIILYSLANIGNGLLAHLHADQETTLRAYAVLRLIAGIGLAGELGAGITLVSELMTKETRGYGTMVVASIGVLGAVVASLVGKFIGWELTYYIGGALGFSLLLLRIGVLESKIFNSIKEKEVSRGDFRMLFSERGRAWRYVNCILIGLPVWYIIGILIGRAPMIASKVLHVDGKIEPEICVMLCYIGLAFGDIVSGALSQILKSRKKVFLIFYALCCISITIYLNLYGVSSTIFYSLILLLGFSVGFWAILVTVGSEQFGTNIRATTATTVPNFVRGSLVPISLLFDYLFRYFKLHTSFDPLIATVVLVTTLVFLISSISLYFLGETFGKDLNYIEENHK
jgi:putative MFS transporter